MLIINNIQKNKKNKYIQIIEYLIYERNYYNILHKRLSRNLGNYIPEYQNTNTYIEIAKTLENSLCQIFKHKKFRIIINDDIIHIYIREKDIIDEEYLKYIIKKNV